MKGRLGDRQRILHIIDAIEQLEFYTADIKVEEFMANTMMQFACIKQIEIIGEASNHITQDLKSDYPEIDWFKIIGMRNFLIHEYFGVTLNIVWQVIHNDVPILKVQMQQIIDNLPGPSFS